MRTKVSSGISTVWSLGVIFQRHTGSLEGLLGKSPGGEVSLGTLASMLEQGPSKLEAGSTRKCGKGESE